MPSTAVTDARAAGSRFWGARLRNRAAAALAPSGGGARRRQLLGMMAKALGIAVDEMDSGWEGLQLGGAGAKGAAGAAPPGPPSPALAVGSDRGGKGFALHAVNSMVAVHVLDAASGLPVATHSPRCGGRVRVRTCHRRRGNPWRLRPLRRLACCTDPPERCGPSLDRLLRPHNPAPNATPAQAAVVLFRLHRP
jgi:hypothetical protein